MNADTLNMLIGRDLPAAARGDTAAYSRVVGACQNSITAIALAMVRDVHASEDIAQEAFLSAWQNIRKLHNPSSFLPWLRQITRNLARDHLRGRQRQPRGGDDMEAAIASAADPAPSAVECLIENERARVAAELICALPDESREVLLLYYREGRSSQQVASLLGLSDAAVRKRLSRARGAVREELLERFAVFAQASAPSVGFTSLVASALGVIAPPGATTAVVAASSLGSGLAGKVGAGGLGQVGASVGASGGVLGGAAGFLIERVLSPVSVAAGGAPLDAASFATRLQALSQYQAGIGLGGIVGGAIAGFAMTWLISRHLMSYAGDAHERRRIARLVRTIAASSAALSVALLVSIEASRGWVVPLVATVIAIALSLWQWLIVMPRALAPSIERIRREHGDDPRDSRTYRWLLGPQAMAWSSLALIATICLTLWHEGRFG